MTASPYRKRIAEEEFLRLPSDGKKCELVDGEAREVPAGFEHDAIAALVAFLLYPCARRYGVVTSSQAGFRMKIGNLRSPDVGFTWLERLPSDGRLPYRITIFSSPTQSVTYEDEEITAGDLIPGFRTRVGDLFDVPKPPDSGS
jgi:hypothetical protein